MANDSGGCARPTGAKVGEASVEEKTDNPVTEETKLMTAKVGQAAPDFQAPAYYKGDFTTVKLADFIGKWVLLCFYPGDFTFV